LELQAAICYLARAKLFAVAAQAAAVHGFSPTSTFTVAPIASFPTSPHLHNDRAIHQGLGTVLLLLESGHVLTRHSARRLSELPASSLPLSLAALSSLPRPSDQVIHPKRSYMGTVLTQLVLQPT
jgi:hypothetical protein